MMTCLLHWASWTAWRLPLPRLLTWRGGAAGGRQGDAVPQPQRRSGSGRSSDEELLN